MRLVTLVPSRPAIGESFTAKRIDSVGGSIGCACSGSVTLGSQIVFDTVAVVSPAIEMMSPALRLVGRHALQPAEGHDLGRAAGLDDLAVIIERVDRHVGLDRTREDQAGQDAAEEIVAVEQGHEELERTVRIGRRRRHMIDDLLEQRLQRAFAQRRDRRWHSRCGPRR